MKDHRYSIIVQEGSIQRSYTAYRKGTKLTYGHNSPVGVSVIDSRSKSLVSCIKLK